jgi:hypothetical protein
LKDGIREEARLAEQAADEWGRVWYILLAAS